MAEPLLAMVTEHGELTEVSFGEGCYIKKFIYMGDFQSGQMGQTVNLLSTTSVVRIHHLPPILIRLLF